MDVKKATFNLDPDLHQQLKMAAALQRREMVELVREALTSYFGWNRMTPTEHQEFRLYQLADSQGKGRRANLCFHTVANDLNIDNSIAAQLLQYLEANHRLTIEVWDGVQYRQLQTFPTVECLFMNGGQLHVQLTIPGRMRYEQLTQRREWEAKQPV
jgi:hypothetical protein